MRDGGSSHHAVGFQGLAQRVEPLKKNPVQTEGDGGLDIQRAIVDEERMVLIATGDAQRTLVDPLVGLRLSQVTGDKEPPENGVEREQADPMLVQLARLVIEREQTIAAGPRERTDPLQG